MKRKGALKPSTAVRFALDIARYLKPGFLSEVLLIACHKKRHGFNISYGVHTFSVLTFTEIMSEFTYVNHG
jgi:hypothetical protein